jgi:hypothetical protein
MMSSPWLEAAKIMDYYDAITEILEKAESIKLPGYRLSVVAVARREFAKRGGCDSKFIDRIESTLRQCLQGWTSKQKREIWLSTETGANNGRSFEAYDEASIDMDLEGELMCHLIEELSPPRKGNDLEWDEEFNPGD